MTQPEHDEGARMFALTRGPMVVGYGMVLPDGSAISVSWPADRGAAVYSSATAEQCALLRGADVRWIGV